MKIDEKLKKHFKMLGLNIKKLREAKELTIEEMSLKTGIRKEYLKKIEIGTAYGVTLEKHLLKIARVLKTNFSELFNFEEI